MRVESMDKLLEEIDKQIRTNKYFGGEEFPYKKREKKVKKFGRVIEYYEYEDSTISLEHNPIGNIVKVNITDMDRQEALKISDLVKRHEIFIKDFICKTTDYDENLDRMKKELCEKAWFEVPAKDGNGTQKVYQLNMKRIDHLILTELHDLEWETEEINWKNLAQRELSEPFMREFQNKLDWNMIRQHQTHLSNKFKKEFSKKLRKRSGIYFIKI